MTNHRLSTLLALLGTTVFLSLAFAQLPPARRHTRVQSDGNPKLVPATSSPTIGNRVTIQIEGNYRVIRANGVPDHMTGAFPNGGNPHRIEAQDYVYRIPAKPTQADQITPLGMHNFGIAINGVPFDPGAAEWYLGQRNSRWQYEALAGAVPLGIDVSHAHVQPTGAYHYHGLPTTLLDTVKLSANQHSPVIGWAADGFPIYAIYGYAEARDPKSKIRALKSSYRLKQGRRPNGPGEPGGMYDGTFVADYEYADKLGDLDECNGRFCITPEFPQGTYAYFLSTAWPVIPRCYRGTPSADFQRRPRLPPR